VAGAPSVFIDDVQVGRIGARTLFELGHRRIGLISGLDEDPLNFEVPKQRKAGFDDELRAAGIPEDPALVVGGNFGIDGGQEAMARLLDLEDPPTAVFAMSDEMAFGALMELSRRSLEPGDDIAVLGVDDHDVARVVALSTIRQDVPSQGAAAARALIGAMTGADVDLEPAIAPIELVLRATTGPRRDHVPSR
jgi:DNA-binding LacI/PurR family transcriptional regulator